MTAAATSVDWVAGMELSLAENLGLFWAEWKSLSKVGSLEADSVSEELVVSTSARRELWMVALSIEGLSVVHDYQSRTGPDWYYCQT